MKNILEKEDGGRRREGVGWGDVEGVVVNDKKKLRVNRKNIDI